MFVCVYPLSVVARTPPDMAGRLGALEGEVRRLRSQLEEVKRHPPRPPPLSGQSLATLRKRAESDARVEARLASVSEGVVKASGTAAEASHKVARVEGQLDVLKTMLVKPL